jgi:hypothetical protein
MTSRQFLRTSAAATACPAVAATTSGCTRAQHGVDQALLLRRALTASGPSAEQLHELVRCATLAANGHNTQPWRFHLEPDRITISPDFSRRTPAVDPDDHHLWVSLGCATGNPAQAAGALGKHADVELTSRDVRMSLANAAPERSPLVDAIFHRQSTRADYDGRPLPSGVLRTLERAGSGNGVE